MPFLLPAAATAVAAAAPAAAATTAAATAGATLTSIATNIAMNVAISAVMSALQPQVGAAGRTAEWTLSPDGPIPFAAGRIGVAGAVVHRATFGPDLMYLGVPAVLSGSGPIDGYESFKADDEWVNFDGNGKATSSQYAGELWYRKTLGNQPDVAVTSPPGLKSNATLPGWGAQHKLSGKAAYMVVMGENSKGTAFPTGEIKPLITLRGLKGWDPRLDSTWPGGVGPCRLDNPATWVYLRRPGLWGLKWALGLWEGPTLKGAPAHGSATDYQVGGIGAKLSGIDVSAFVNLENICDANDWTVSAYPTTDDDKFAVLESFLQAGGATFAMRAGKISCIQRAAPRTSIVTISAADTAGPLEIDTAASRIDRINTIRPRIMSEAHRWQMTAIAEVSAQTYRDQDGGTRPRGIDYTYVSNATQGAQLAALQIANTREGIAGVIPLKPHLQKIKPGDAFTITEPGFVLNGLKCLCLSTEFEPTTKIVAVSFVSETDAKYPFALGQSQVPPEPAVLEPVDPRYVSPPGETEWTVVPRPPSDGGAQVPGFDLVGEVDNATATALLVEWGPGQEGPWTQAYLGPPTAVRVPLTGIQPGQIYFVSVMNIRDQNYSERRVMGPFTAPALVADNTNALGARSAVEVLNSLDAIEDEFNGLPAVVAAVDAARSAAEQAAADADGIYDATVTIRDSAAGFASSSQSSAVAASNVFKATVAANRNPNFQFGVEAWNYPEHWTAVASDGGKQDLIQSVTGINTTLTSQLIPIPQAARFRLKLGFRQKAGPETTYYAGMFFYDADGNPVAASDGTGNYPLGAAFGMSAGQWVYREVVVGKGWAGGAPYGGTVAIPAGASSFRLCLYVNYANQPGVVVQVDHFEAIDVTQEIDAYLQAQASAGHASTALTYRDQAGNFASSAASAATLAAQAASGSILGNSRFQDWTTLIAGWPAPWANYDANGPAPTKVNGEYPGASPGNAMQQAAPAGQNTYVGQATAAGTLTGGGWYVVFAEFRLDSGILPGSGLYVVAANAAMNGLIGYTLPFDTDPNNNTGAAIGNGSPGRVYRFARLIQMTASADVSRMGFYAMTSWGGFAGGSAWLTARQLTWFSAGARPATREEIETGYARQGFNSLASRFESVAAVAASANSTTAGQLNTLVSRIDGGLIGPNDHFDDGLNGWDIQYAGPNTGHQASYQGRRNCAVAPAGQRLDIISKHLYPVDPSRKYRLKGGIGVFGAAGQAEVYLGFMCCGADGNAIPSNPGSWLYALNVGYIGSAVNGWADNRSDQNKVNYPIGAQGPITGEGIGSWAIFPVGTKYVRLLAYLNYNQSPRAVALDYMEIEEITQEARITETQNTLATLEGRVEATAGLTVQAGNRVAGMRFHAVDGTDQNYSSVDFLADVFRVWDTVAQSGRAPFEVRNGGVRMNSAFVDRLAVGVSLTVGSTNLRVAVQPFTITATDGVAKSYGYDLGTNPTLVFGPCPVPLNAGETYAPTADNQSPTGFTPRFKITTPGTPTNQSYGPSNANPLTLSGYAGYHFALAGPAKDGNITVSAQGTFVYDFYNFSTGQNPGEPMQEYPEYDFYTDGYLSLGVYGYNGSSWARLGGIDVPPGFHGRWDSSGQKSRSYNESVALQIGSNITHIGVVLEAESHAGSNLASMGSTYQTASTGSVRSATPNGELISVQVFPKNGA